MFKVLVIQAANTLSDERAESLINDRLSFMRFLGLSLADRVPAEMSEKLTAALDETLSQNGHHPEITGMTPAAKPPADRIRRRVVGPERPDCRWRECRYQNAVSHNSEAKDHVRCLHISLISRTSFRLKRLPAKPRHLRPTSALR
jgi:hypothetical protein